MQTQLMIESHDLSTCRADWTWALPAGSEWVVEGRGSAAFALYQLPLSAAARPSPLAWLRSTWHRLWPAASPAPQHCGA